MRINVIHYIMYTIFICIIILQCDDVFTDNSQAAGDESTRPVTVAELSEKMRIIKGDYFGGPAYAEGTPFRFKINDLAPTIDVSKVFVVATGYKTNESGVIECPCKITWSVKTSSTDNIIEFFIEDAEGNSYQDPATFGTMWYEKRLLLKFHAYYVSDMPDAAFVE